MIKLSEHFTLEEFTFSQTAVRHAINNSPTSEILTRLRFVAAGLELVRSLLGGNAIRVSSGYRCRQLNKLVGGSPTSAHEEGWAVDFTCPGFGSPKEVARAIAESGIEFDQLIYEGTWVHISFAPKKRREVLTAHFYGNGKVSYTKGIE